MSETIVTEAPFGVRFEVITPKRAQELIDTAENVTYTTAEGLTTSNRKVSPQRVARYAEDMQEGFWQPTHQGLAIDTEGNLLDGQHRLAAVVQTGVPVTMMVCYGVPVETFWLMDGGYSRSAQSFLDGPYGQQRSALTRTLMTIEKNGGWARKGGIGSGKYSTSMILHYLSTHPAIQTYALGYAKQAGRAGRSGKFGTSTVGLLLGGYIAGEDKWGQWWEQIDDLLTGRGGEKDSPVTALYRVAPVGGNMTAVNYMRAIYCGVKFRDGEPLRMIRANNLDQVPVW